MQIRTIWKGFEPLELVSGKVEKAGMELVAMVGG